MKSIRLGHVHLPVSDLTRSIAFYRDNVGLGVGYQSETMAEFGEVGVVLDQADAPSVVGEGVIVGLAVDDVDAVYEELTSRGVAMDAAPEDQPWGVRNFYVSDPDGHQLEFEQPSGPV